MPLYWLVYRHNNQISVVIEPGASLVHARMRSAIDELGQGEFTEGHELDRKWKIAKEMVGRRLLQEEAKWLLSKFDPGRISERFQTIPSQQNPRRSRSACDDYSGSDEQMFGAKQQIPHGLRSDQQA